VSDVNPKPAQLAFNPKVIRIAKDVAAVVLVVKGVVVTRILNDDPPNVTPQQTHPRAVRIGLVIGMVIVYRVRGIVMSRLWAASFLLVV
jgi:hypothetical protein